MATFNVYVISYKRSNAIKTEKHLEYCTYVVRKSEEQAYKDAGVRSVWGIEDELIDSCTKVMNYLVENAPEDVIVVIDDDCTGFTYRLDNLEKITDPVVVSTEIERLAQLVYDLNIGYLASPSSSRLLYYKEPFEFTGVTGALKVYNRKVLKARYRKDLIFVADMDFELTELLHNRIMLIPAYFTIQHDLDTNEGGNSARKTTKLEITENEMLANKWGRYYQKMENGKPGKIRVKR